LLESIDSLELDGDSLLELVPELSVLKSKLPPDIHNLDEPFLDTSSDKIAELRTEVQELLIARLLQHEGTR
jgi:exonuclease SbcD